MTDYYSNSTAKPVSRIAALTLLIGLAGGSTSCGKTEITEVTPASTSCQTNQAQIAVQDGSMKILCGCNETPNQRFVPPTSLTCTVSAGTQISFIYMATTLEHQIVSSGTPAFASSPLSDPKALFPIGIYPVVFSVSGTYGFFDAYNQAMNGQIVVR